MEEVVERETIDLMKFVIIRPEIMQHIVLSLHPNFRFDHDTKLWCLRSESMEQSFFIRDDLFKELRFCEECFFILTEEKDDVNFYKHVSEIHFDQKSLDIHEPSKDFI